MPANSMKGMVTLLIECQHCVEIGVPSIVRPNLLSELLILTKPYLFSSRLLTLNYFISVYYCT